MSALSFASHSQSNALLYMVNNGCTEGEAVDQTTIEVFHMPSLVCITEDSYQ